MTELDPTGEQSKGITASGIPALNRRVDANLNELSSPQTALDYNDGRIAIIRSFEYDILRRVEALRSDITVETIDTVSYGRHSYPIFELTASKNLDNPYVRLSGLVHGDEEAGGKAILNFFEGPVFDYLDRFNFIANPCVNPSGYETASLQAMNGYHPEYRFEKNTGNINRSFGGALDQREARIIEESLRKGPPRYIFAADMHESPPYYQDEAYVPEDAPKGAWLYESCRGDGVEIGRNMTDTLPKHLAACDWDVIYSDKADGGVIAFSEDTTQHAEYSEPTSLDGHYFTHYTDHSFTFETPTGWKLEERIEAQLHFLTYVLGVYRGRLS